MKVLLATPAYGGQVTEAYFQSVLTLVHAAHGKGVQIDVMTLTNESLITRGRNEIVATFMGGNWTDLFWVDADIRFDPEHFWKLLDAPYEVCATPYAMKGLDWDKMAATGGNAQTLRYASVMSVVNSLPDAPVVDGFMQALDAGTGFMRIKRAALERMIAAHPELEYKTEKPVENPTRWALFDTMIHEGRYLSEDYTFCRRWQDLGGEVWVDVTSASLGHQGSYTFGK